MPATRGQPSAGARLGEVGASDPTLVLITHGSLPSRLWPHGPAISWWKGLLCGLRGPGAAGLLSPCGCPAPLPGASAQPPRGLGSRPLAADAAQGCAAAGSCTGPASGWCLRAAASTGAVGCAGRLQPAGGHLLLLQLPQHHRPGGPAAGPRQWPAPGALPPRPVCASGLLAPGAPGHAADRGDLLGAAPGPCHGEVLRVQRPCEC